METKVCNRCGQELPIDEFYQVPSATLDELHTFCKNILRYSPSYTKQESIESEDKEPQR